ncbi:helix-turn-helix domain-containing protein [Pseudobutyrivibrio xylanivorans]|nr:helix-turn-helix transcriptional regulator [Pseudobutyrivibrio xylanivorans]
MAKIGFGGYLQKLREQKKWTQAFLAEKVDCMPSTISRIENEHEFPEIKLLKKFNGAFERMGIEFNAVTMEELFGFKKARVELLMAIRKRREEEIERKLDKFQKVMDKNDTEDMQYFVLAHLIFCRKNGMTVEAFLDKSIEVYEMCRCLPDFEDIPMLTLTPIEYEILFIMGESYMISGKKETAELIFDGLFKNSKNNITPFAPEKLLEISAIMARVCLMKNDYDKTDNFLKFIFDEFINKVETRMLFNALFIKSELCKAIDDDKGAILVDSYLDSVQLLMDYMHEEYRIRKDMRGSLL